MLHLVVFAVWGLLPRVAIEVLKLKPFLGAQNHDPVSSYISDRKVPRTLII